MSAFAWTMGIMLVLFYILLPFYIVIKERERENTIKNHPPEIWRIENWHLIDKIRVHDFLKIHLKEIRKTTQIAEEKSK